MEVALELTKKSGCPKYCTRSLDHLHNCGYLPQIEHLYRKLYFSDLAIKYSNRLWKLYRILCCKQKIPGCNIFNMKQINQPNGLTVYVLYATKTAQYIIYKGFERPAAAHLVQDHWIRRVLLLANHLLSERSIQIFFSIFTHSSNNIPDKHTVDPEEIDRLIQIHIHEAVLWTPIFHTSPPLVSRSAQKL